MLVTGVLTVAAALWGAAAGLLVPRAAYRLAVEPDEPWRESCPAGHPFAGPARGWLGTARCARCTARTPVPAGPTPGTPRTPDGTPAPAGVPRTPDGTPAPSGVLRTPDGTPAPPDGTTSRTPDSTPAPSDGTAPHPPHSTPHPRPAMPRTPRHVLLGALVCATLAVSTGPRPELVVWLLLVPFAALLAMVDLRVHRLPDVLTLPLAGAAAGLLGIAELLPGDAGSWPSALLGGLGLGGTYFVLFLVNPRGMGFGDVKLALTLGVVLGWYGWPVLFTGALAGFLLGALYGVALMAARRGSRKTAIPFGPFMLAGAWAGLVLGGLGAA
ncbi:prepilin peptidase [Streptomyces sp. NPDC004111]|uniref:prepilin peptidase n=1 Tax=Streptomyces sp. NPDC004111 TaxID=3364690 RepID=UPI0036C838CA